MFSAYGVAANATFQKESNMGFFKLPYSSHSMFCAIIHPFWESTVSIYKLCLLSATQNRSHPIMPLLVNARSPELKDKICICTWSLEHSKTN